MRLKEGSSMGLKEAFLDEFEGGFLDGFGLI